MKGLEGRTKQKLQALLVVLVTVALLAYGLIYSYLRAQKYVYADHLDQVAVTVDGQELTLGDLYFYILYEERLVEDEARVYNSSSSRDYWNLHTNGSFLKNEAKDAVMGMAVHDEIFYQMAVDEGLMLSLDEKENLTDSQQDFWMDLYEEQIESLPVTEESVNATMEKIAFAEKMQERYAQAEDNHTYRYDWDAHDYETLEAEHSVKINEKVWEQVKLGDISLVHTKTNYINGLDDSEED